MARKKLNKKVAILGSGAIVFILVLIIGAILYLSQSPDKFIKDGKVFTEKARQETDEEIKTEHYEKAIYSYHKARSLAKTDELKVDMLFELVDLFLETDKWSNALGCWNKIVSLEPDNIKALYNRLKYLYILADSGLIHIWQDVDSIASDIIEIVENDDDITFEHDATQWSSFEVENAPPIPSKLGTYLFLARGRAVFETAQRGALTDPNESLAIAVTNLKKAVELQPDNIEAYKYLAETIEEQGRLLASGGNVKERDEAIERAKILLEKAVDETGKAEAYINLINLELTIAASEGRENILALEQQYKDMADKFSADHKVYAAMAVYYQRLGIKYSEQNINAIKKAMQLDKENVNYASVLANLYYREYSMSKQKKTIQKAIKIVKNALEFPGTEEGQGPRSWVRKVARTTLNTLLAGYYVEQILDARILKIGEDEKKQLLAKLENVVHQIEQLRGSGEDLTVIKWQGMLELARGNKKEAIRKLYTTYEQYKASIKDPRQMDAELSYTLGKIFKNTNEVGASIGFLTSAINAYGFINKPQLFLDQADILFRLEAYDRASNLVRIYEDAYDVDERSAKIRIRIYIALKQFDEAEKNLKQAHLKEVDEIKLELLLMRTELEQLRNVAMRKQLQEEMSEQETKVAKQSMEGELEKYGQKHAQLIEKLQTIEPNAVSARDVVFVCNYYLKEDNIQKSHKVVGKFLEYFPKHLAMQIYKQKLYEPDPTNITPERVDEIEKKTIEAISDPINKAMNLGMLHLKNNEIEQAIQVFSEVIDFEQNYEKTEIDLTDEQHIVIGYLFDLALREKNWDMAEKILIIIRLSDYDDCEGNYFTGRMEMQKASNSTDKDIQTEYYKKALERFDSCLPQRPVFSRLYWNKSIVNNALGNEHAAIADAKKAVSLNVLNGDIVRQLAFVLYQRDKKSGDNVRPEQIVETKTAIIRALKTNPRDLQLLAFYAEYISEENPEEALSIRQGLLKAAPTLERAVFLGRLAMRIAEKQNSPKLKKIYLDMAGDAFGKAKKIDPESKIMISGYVAYLKTIGEEEKAVQLLKESQSEKLLWRYYYQMGQLQKANDILMKMYQQDTEDTETIRGILVVAVKAEDIEAAKKYSERLITIDDSVDNLLFQIDVYLNVGIMEETENKLQSFKEKYPDNRDTLLYQAWLTMKQGNMELALSYTNQAIEIEPENPVLWRLRGELNSSVGNYEQAVHDLKKSKELKDLPETRIALAKAYLKKDLPEDAVTELKIAIDDPRAPLNTRILLEQTYHHLQRTGDLAKFYEETLKKFPNDATWNYKAAEFAISIRKFKWAGQMYGIAWRNVKDDAPDRPAIFAGYLRTLTATREVDKMFGIARKYIDTDLAPMAFTAMAAAKLKLGDRETAVDYYKRAVDKSGDNQAYIVNVLAEMYQNIGQAEVLKYCEEKLEADPDALAPNIVMFNLAKMKAEYNKALRYIEKCMKITEGEPQWLEYTVQRATILQIAYARTAEDDYLQKATKQYQYLLEKMPNNLQVLNNLAYMLMDSNEQLDKALEYATRAYELTSNAPAYLDTYAYALYKNNQFEKADKIINSAIQQLENKKMFADAEMYEHLGMIKEKLGQKAIAIEAYKQALNVGEKTMSEKTKEKIKRAIETLSY
ncbi:MAG: tetratricopeptide repeat protein [Planctomycetes bacterium]|nr:tetratricopeptide repeat protein [Planctomycetota bacterium]